MIVLFITTFRQDASPFVFTLKDALRVSALAAGGLSEGGHGVDSMARSFPRCRHSLLLFSVSRGRSILLLKLATEIASHIFLILQLFPN